MRANKYYTSYEGNLTGHFTQNLPMILASTEKYYLRSVLNFKKFLIYSEKITCLLRKQAGVELGLTQTEAISLELGLQKG